MDSFTHSIKILREVLLHSEPVLTSFGGRFFPRHFAEHCFLAFRLLCAVFFFVLVRSVHPLDYMKYVDGFFAYLVVHVMIALLAPWISTDRAGLWAEFCQTLLDVGFGALITFRVPECQLSALAFFLLPLTQASLLGPISFWFIICVLSIGSSIALIIHNPNISSAFILLVLTATAFVMRIYRGTQVKLMNEAGELNRALSGSSALLNSLINNVPLNIYRIDSQKKLVFVNDQYCDTLGKTRQEVLGKRAADLYPRELASIYDADDDKVLEAGAVINKEEPNEPPGKERVFVHVTKKPIYDSSRRIVGLQGVFWDVTAKKAAEESLKQERGELVRSIQELNFQLADTIDQLRASEFLYRGIFDNVSDIIYSHDLNGHFTTLNKAGQRILGYGDPKLDTKTIADVIAPEDVERAREQIRRKLESKNPEEITTYEISLLKKDGTRIPVEVCSRLCRVGNQVVGVHGIVRDIAIRRQREQERLLEQRKDFINLVESTYDVFDPTEAVRLIVNECPALLAKTTSIPIAVSVYTVFVPRHGVSPEDQLHKDQVNIRFEAGAGNTEFESDLVKWRRFKPLEETMELTLEMLVDRKTKLFQVKPPISTRARLLRGTRSVFMLPFSYRNRAMGYLVAESSAITSDEAFPDETQGLLRLIGMFLGLITGRFRLLTDGLCSLLHQHIFVSQIQSALHQLKAQPKSDTFPLDTKSLDDLLQDCQEEFKVAYRAYEIARGSQAKPRANTIPVVPLISSAIGRFQRVLPREANPRIAFALEEIEVNLVYCIELELRSILFEVFLNAWRFKSSASEIVVSVVETESSVEISVINEIDFRMPPEITKRVFEPAYRWTPPNKTEDECIVSGTGLGLWQASILLEAQNGKITFTNEPAHQVRVAISLPRDPVH